MSQAIRLNKPINVFPQTSPRSLTKFFVERFVPYYEARAGRDDLSPQSIKSYRSELRQFSDFVGKDPVLDDLTPERIEDFSEKRGTRKGLRIAGKVSHAKHIMNEIARCAVREGAIDEPLAAFGVFDEGAEHSLISFVKQEFPEPPRRRKYLGTVLAFGRLCRVNPTLEHLTKEWAEKFLSLYARRVTSGHSVLNMRTRLYRIWRRAKQRYPFVEPAPEDGRRRRSPKRPPSDDASSLRRVFEERCHPALFMVGDLGTIRLARFALDEFDAFVGRATTTKDLTQSSFEAFMAWCGNRVRGRRNATVENLHHTSLMIWYCVALAVEGVDEPSGDVPHRAELKVAMHPDSLGQFFHRVFRKDALAACHGQTVAVYWSIFRHIKNYLGHVPMLEDLTREKLLGFREYLESGVTKRRGKRSLDSVRSICTQLYLFWDYAARTPRPKSQWVGPLPETYAHELPLRRWLWPRRSSGKPKADEKIRDAFRKRVPGENYPMPEGAGGFERAHKAGRKGSLARPIVVREFEAARKQGDKVDQNALLKKINSECKHLIGSKAMPKRMTPTALRALVRRMRKEGILPPVTKT